MRVVPINEAEAIIEPFWDGGSSEHPTDKLSLLDEYRVTIPPAVLGRVRQTWCSIQVEFEHATPADGPIVLERDCDISLAGYDVLRVFASLPEWLAMTVRATVDGQSVTPIDGVRGTNTNDEFDGPITGQRMTALRMEFVLTETRPASAPILWIGLANRAAQQGMEARRSPYTAEWPRLLIPAGEAAARADAFQPQIGILFDSAGLDGLRARVRSALLREDYAALKAQAERDLALHPEEDIGTFIAKPDRRWCRNRDMKKVPTAGIMERLALVGLIEQDIRMSQMAARMALSAAHCDTWCETIIGVFPGATWHHRSFTEEVYARACGLVLDWAGFCLSPHAQQVIRDAIVMKGLPRIESDFKRMEYIRQMNQGIVFSSGRIFGTLALLPAYPRYRSLVEEAERDLHEMIATYVLPDGGTLEGMAYWNYTFSQVMPSMLALARYHGQTLLDYGAANPSLVKTGDYGLGMLSTVGDGTSYVPVNDAHAGASYVAGLVAAYVRLSGRPEWQALYRALAQARSAEGSKEPRGGADMYHIIVAPSEDELREAPPLLRERFDVFPATGQVASVRALGGKLVHFHLCTGPTYLGHFHEDKGAFILEVDGEPLIYDRGVTSYDHPEVSLIGMAARHNLLYPEAPDGRLMRQPSWAKGGTLLSAEQRDGQLMLASDQREAWAEGVFELNVRRVYSPAPELYIIDDEIAMPEARRLSFRVNSPAAMTVQDGALVIAGERSRVLVAPLNWQPAEAQAGIEGIDCHLHPAYLGRLATEPLRAARLLTMVQVVPAGWEAPAWSIAERSAAGAVLSGPEGRRIELEL